jgi:hypothetical protein
VNPEGCKDLVVGLYWRHTKCACNRCRRVCSHCLS